MEEVVLQKLYNRELRSSRKPDDHQGQDFAQKAKLQKKPTIIEKRIVIVRKEIKITRTIINAAEAN